MTQIQTTNSSPLLLAQQLSASTLVPTAFRGNDANCLIALELADRLKVSPLAVVQNLHIIQGKPSWSSSFLIGLLNNSGRFTTLTYRTTNDNTGKEQSWQAVATERETGKELTGPVITLAMAKAEGWLTKGGSKWQTMPELMGRYRAAAFFARIFAPELCLGLLTEDESRDIAAQRSAIPPQPKGSLLAGLKRAESVQELTPIETLADAEQVQDAEAQYQPTKEYQDLVLWLGDKCESAVKHLTSVGWLKEGQTLFELSTQQVSRIYQNQAFLDSAGITLTQQTQS